MVGSSVQSPPSTHHPAPSETKGVYDGKYLWINDLANGRLARVRLDVFETDAILKIPNMQGAHGIAVVLDVVYNHFGPDGNYLHVYAPDFFSQTKHSPWGAAINFDGPHSEAVRDFFRHNALYWVEEFHFDGLRMDAVHAIHDSSPLHIAAEIAQALHTFGHGAGRPLHLVLENDANKASLLERGADGQPLFATAQWNDDLHHAAHVLLTGETDGYYGDYAEGPIGRFARALAQGFVYQGQPSPHRGNLRQRQDGRLREGLQLAVKGLHINLIAPGVVHDQNGRFGATAR